MNRRYVPESTWAELRTAHASGIGLRELARHAGVAPGTVLSRAKRENWSGQLRQARAIVQTSPASPAIDVSSAAAASMTERGQRHLQRVAGIVEKTLPHVEGMEPGAILDRVDDFDRLDRIARRTYGLDVEGTGAVRINIFTQFDRSAVMPAIDV